MVTFPNTRTEQISFILSRLNELKQQSNESSYAIEQNIKFFESVSSISRYIKWLYGARRTICGTDLLEINELLPELDEEFHAKMAEMERQPSPGIIRPLVDSVIEVAQCAPPGSRFRIASLGSGSMEVERQITERLQRQSVTRPLTIVGFDISQNTRAFAKKNIGTLERVRVVAETGLTQARLYQLEQETQESVLVIVADNDIFTIASDFGQHSFDFAVTALFLHHLDTAGRVKIIEDMKIIAPQTLNYDGYKNEIVVPILSVAGWGSPIFLNAAIFSTVRFPSRTEVRTLHHGAQIDFYKHGHYRAIFSS